MPAEIATATEELAREELKACIVEILEADFEKIDGKGLTFAKIKTHILGHEDVIPAGFMFKSILFFIPTLRSDFRFQLMTRPLLCP